jgi:hypothetical protein
MKNLLKFIAISFGVSVMTGCSVVPTATPEQKKIAIEMSAPSDKATLYAIRNDKGSYHAHQLELKIGSETLLTRGMSFAVFSLNPVTGKLETDIGGIVGTDAEIPMDLKAGQKYYVHVSQHFRPLIGPRAELVELSESEAVPLLKKLTMVAEPEKKSIRAK